MNEKYVLVVEDDKTIQNFLKISLKTKGYRCEIAEDGLTGISCFLANNPDIILLDLGLPDIDGMEVLKQIRAESDIPVIIISARGQEKEKVAALDEGADDYITKPFHINELLARVRVALRRYKKEDKAETEYQLDYFRINLEKRKVYVHEEEVHLTPIEYKMVVLLVENRGKVVTHNYMQKQVWGYDSTDDYQSLRVFMANIRRKIEDDTSNPRFILTEVGVGYRFVDE